MKNYVTEDIDEALSESGQSAVRLSHEEALKILSDITEKFTVYRGSGILHWLWDGYFTEDYSVCDPEAYRWIAEFTGENECLFIAYAGNNEEVYVFENGEALADMYYNSYGNEFYVTDREYTYLFSFNHHDYLSACGEALEWLRKYCEEHGVKGRYQNKRQTLNFKKIEISG